MDHDWRAMPACFFSILDLRRGVTWAKFAHSGIWRLNMIARIYLLLALVGSPAMATAASCEDLEDVDERLGCLEGRYCADAKSDAERAQCYEDIVRGLLTSTMRPERGAEEAPTATPAAGPAPDEAMSSFSPAW